MLADVETVWMAMELTTPLQFEYELLGSAAMPESQSPDDRMLLVVFRRKKPISVAAADQF
jgi:hypothetical protein